MYNKRERERERENKKEISISYRAGGRLRTLRVSVNEISSSGGGRLSDDRETKTGMHRGRRKAQAENGSDPCA